MAEKPKNNAKTRKAAAPSAEVKPLSRQEWTLAFESRVDRLRPGMGSKYLATIVATLYPKHHGDDPESVATQWVKERE